ncbi:MAG: SOS response-associated peptidase [Bacteroidales bacterium]|nr:SOS response-associated peptidase [Bacteroidales bacterium]
MPRKYILASNLETIEGHFGAKTNSQLEWDPKIVISPGDESLIITQQNPGEFTLSAFGMTPAWAKTRMQIINARAEGDKNPENNPEFKGSTAIFLKPAFQKPLFSRRCIVIADAIIEWSSGILPKPHLFYLRDHKHPIGFAGLYDIWINPETRAQVHSFAIITVAANSLIRSLPSSRMPVILQYGQESRWLKPTLGLAEILGMLTITPSKQMNGYSISSKIDQPGPYSKEILLPQGPKLLSEDHPPPLPRQLYYGHKKKPVDNIQTLGELLR